MRKKKSDTMSQKKKSRHPMMHSRIHPSRPHFFKNSFEIHDRDVVAQRISLTDIVYLFLREGSFVVGDVESVGHCDSVVYVSHVYGSR